MNAKYVVPKALILISTLYAMIRMWHWAMGFTYFTQLSNLFVALAVIAQLATRSHGNSLTAAAKFAATVSILVTFLVYLLLLAPMTPGGFFAAYREDGYASLCLHFITPLLTLWDFLSNDAGYPWSFRHALCATLPPIAYFLLMLLLRAMGLRWYRGMSAPYMFLNYAAPCGWFGIMPETAGPTTLGIGVGYVMLLLLGLFIILGQLLIRASRRVSQQTG